ncbi:MAG: hypothetical protein KatS3mg110_3364 [Pirellulaceae bacterium]|nr:MAG: hypothetical protein KatS3mg110_3364 [Pirellulaceae bacterium]
MQLVTDKWYHAQQFGGTYWLYVVWNLLGRNLEMLRIQNPAEQLDHANREIAAARFDDILAEAVGEVVKRSQKGERDA